jgi:hypothetical protein
MKILAVKVPSELDSRLSGLASSRGSSKSAVVRQLLSEALSKNSGDSDGSFLEQARDLCGCVDGPADLSCNPAHLKGYGQ